MPPVKPPPATIVGMDECRVFYAGTAAADGEVEPIRQAAHEVVLSRSDPPAEDAPERGDYVESAHAAQLLVGRWLWRTDGGTLSSKSISPVISRSYMGPESVFAIARAALGPYYKDNTQQKFPIGMFVIPGASDTAETNGAAS